MTHAENAHAIFQDAIGKEQPPGDWFLIDQERINAFAEVTEDRQFIHIDPVKSAELSPYGVPIAHGFLTLSMLSHLVSTVPVPPERLEGISVGINYGFEKVRFLSPVKVDSRIRAVLTLRSADLKNPNTIQVTNNISVEIEGESKPALIADWVSRAIYS